MVVCGFYWGLSAAPSFCHPQQVTKALQEGGVTPAGEGALHSKGGHEQAAGADPSTAQHQQSRHLWDGGTA